MKTIGIICEYNPLHNGHVYHFNKVKEESKADCVILSLSSYLTQRGDLAILDKFKRTELALKLGVDLVIECPALLSMNEAQIFADAHVKNLINAGANEIWIGAEDGDEEIFRTYHNLIHSNKFNKLLDENIALGLSYKEAFNKSIYSFNLPMLKSNDMLGLFYYEAILKLKPSVKLKTIKRTNSFIENSIINSSIQSASSIRNNLSLAKDYVPSYVLPYLSNILDNNLLVPFIKFNILNINLNELAECSEGIENRLKYACGNSIDEMISSIKTRRYSESKLRRLLMDTCFQIKKQDVTNAITNYNYLRILGFNPKGQNLIKNFNKNITVYTNIKEGINPILDFEIKISKIIDLIYHTNLLSAEITKPIIKGA